MRPAILSVALLASLAMLTGTSSGAVAISSFRPSPRSPQAIGTPITWTAKATDSNSNLLTFQFSIAPPGGKFAMIKDFNAGVLSKGAWSSQPFVWVPAGIEGKYTIKAVAKDFVSGESATGFATFELSSLVTDGTPVVVPTANPLVALFSSPSCAAGSYMRVSFRPQVSGGPPGATNWLPCHPPNSMTFEVAGMYPNATYELFSQTKTGGTVANGSAIPFSTGSLPTNISLPTFNTVVAPGPSTDTTDALVLHNMVQFGQDHVYSQVATDLAGKILWYYTPSTGGSMALTRPLSNGTFLTEEYGTAWQTFSQELQMLRQVDLAGNTLRETNTGALQQQLLAMGVADGGPCDAIPHPAPVGAGCLGSFHHDAIQTLPGGKTAVLVDIEKIFPAGTQGETSGLPVDIMGDMILVLDQNWQVVWYWDSFEHAGGAPELDINRGAILGETCVNNFGGCPPIFLLGSGIAPKTQDWLHMNSLYYWPQRSDLIVSIRHQDWIIRLDYKDGAGSGNVLWRMGNEGDFSMTGSSDPYPWFSHQHDVGIEAAGGGVMTMFDNGNTRISTKGLGSNCGPNDCRSRGMAVSFDEASMTVSPVLSVDLGVYSNAMGSAQLLANGDYFFVPAIVFKGPNAEFSYDIEVLPAGVSQAGTQVYNLSGGIVYRAWRLPDMYHPPTT